jgi:hypothetical protein
MKVYSPFSLTFRESQSLIGNCYAGLSRLSIKWMDAR